MRNIRIGSMANPFNSLNGLRNKNQEFCLSVFLFLLQNMMHGFTCFQEVGLLAQLPVGQPVKNINAGFHKAYKNTL